MSDDPALGAMVVVYRNAGSGVEYLVLHRAHAGPEYEGDWAWGPPSGAREPGEFIDECAARELAEETGLVAPLRRVAFREPRWAVYVTEVQPDASIRLSDEHDRWVWVGAEDAVALVSPEIIVEQLRGAIDERESDRR